jgi:toxin HigB-1
VIASFGDRATEAFYHEVPAARARRFPPNIESAARRKLDMLEAATSLDDLRSPPGNRLEALRGELAGFHSIRINDQWRIVFRWASGDASEVRVTDYHR